MILVIAPAIDGLRREWREAASSLGASSWQFWRHVGLPILFPSLLSAMVLLFGNSFAAYATAYGLTAGGIGLVPIVIGFFLGGDVLDDPHLAQALAFGMFVVLGLMMLAYIPLQRRQLEVGAMTPRRFIAPSAVVWLLIGAAYFLVPLIATLLFSLKNDQTAKCCTLANYGGILDDPRVLEDDPAGFVIALETIAFTLALLVPTVYWVHLKLPRLRPVIGFLALVPFVVAPIILVVGLLDLVPRDAHVVLRRAVRLPRRDVRDPRLPVHVLLARRGLPGDRRAHPDRGLAEPRGGLADDALPRDPPEHQGGRARRLVPDARDRDGRVHDREPGAVQHLPGATSSTSTRTRRTRRQR